MLSYDLREYVIRPVLQEIEKLDPRIKATAEAEDLLVMICAHESKGGKYLNQKGGGKGLGIYQIEENSYNDLILNYLRHRPLRLEIMGSFVAANNLPVEVYLRADLLAQTAAARFMLRRIEEPFPKAKDYPRGRSDMGYLNALALYAKNHWNTDAGKATSAKYLNDYLKYNK